MEVRLAKSAGFCFGVNKAMEKVYEQIDRADGKKIYTYGPIIHNEEVVKELAAKGVEVIESLEELKEKEKGILIIRSHGVAKEVCERMEKAGFTSFLARLLKPLLHRLFPSCARDQALAGHLSANICANFLGLGNAATPMGIHAAQRLAAKRKDGIAGNELCRLIVLNTASIQLIPANVAAVRASLGCATPFDILPAVWITSLCSAGLGLTAAWFLGKVWRK